MKYIAYYDTLENKEEKRNYILAATNKMNYICQALNAIGENVEIVSASGTWNKCTYRGKKVNLNDQNTLKLFFSLGRGNKVKNVLDRFILKVLMFFYLLKNIKKDEKVIVYHSLGYMKLISLLKKLKKFYLILEVEEIYADVIGRTKIKNHEIEFFADADAYIFPTSLLNDLINKKNKPYCIIHGTYGVEPDRNVSFDDDKIHVVYAGTFDPRKGGATAAAAAAEFLSKKYHIHILGFGTAKDTALIQDVVEKTNAKGNGIVTYDGLLSGEEYIEFLQKCHIGLSTQNPDADFNATSFPSKILSYMANGLRVVTVRIPAIEGSAVGNDLFYYEKQTPEEIAKAIIQVDLQDNYDSRKKIHEMNKKFNAEFKNVLEEII